MSHSSSDPVDSEEKISSALSKPLVIRDRGLAETVTSKWQVRAIAGGAGIAIAVGLTDYLAATRGSADRWVGLTVIAIGVVGLLLAGSAWLNVREAVFRLSSATSRVTSTAGRLDETSNAGLVEEANLVARTAEADREVLIEAGAYNEAAHLTDAVEHLQAALTREKAKEEASKGPASQPIQAPRGAGGASDQGPSRGERASSHRQRAA